MTADQIRALTGSRLWLLRLVPDFRGGRWLSGAVILLILLAFFGSAGALERTDNWAAALFFCAILSYITPIFHFVTERTLAAFDELSDRLELTEDARQRFRAGIVEKSTGWVSVNLAAGCLCWLLQSLLLAGGVSNLLVNISGSFVGFAMGIGPLPVWIFMFAVTHALVDNARTFRKLTRLIRLDPLDTSTLLPFGRMAVASTLVVIGAQALFPIMWLGAETDPWTTIPGLLGTSIALIYLFAAPVWPLHKRLREFKRAELRTLQSRIVQISNDVQEPVTDPTLTAVLVYRREVMAMTEWPFDISVMARLGVYLFIVPLTWIGAALIENLVDLFIAN
jgi:hypothetical protein